MKEFMMKKIPRRKFIAGIGHKLGVLIGFSVLVNQIMIPGTRAQTIMADNLDTNPVNVGANNLHNAASSQGADRNKFNRRILIVYASQFGSTREIAERVSNRLVAKGNHIVLMHVDQVESLDGYDAAIIGGAIQYDKWMGSARHFVKKFQPQLESMPVACFFGCLTLSRHDDASLAQAQGYAEKISALFSQSKPVSVQGFAGVLDYRKMSIPVRIVAKLILSIIGVKEGDYRDWPAIDNWTDVAAVALSDK